MRPDPGVPAGSLGRRQGDAGGRARRASRTASHLLPDQDAGRRAGLRCRRPRDRCAEPVAGYLNAAAPPPGRKLRVKTGRIRRWRSTQPSAVHPGSSTPLPAFPSTRGGATHPGEDGWTLATANGYVDPDEWLAEPFVWWLGNYCRLGALASSATSASTGCQTRVDSTDDNRQNCHQFGGPPDSYAQPSPARGSWAGFWGSDRPGRARCVVK